MEQALGVALLVAGAFGLVLARQRGRPKGWTRNAAPCRASNNTGLGARRDRQLLRLLHDAGWEPIAP